MAHFIDDDVHFMATEVLPSCERENENFSDAPCLLFSRLLLAKRLNFLSSLSMLLCHLASYKLQLRYFVGIE